MDSRQQRASRARRLRSALTTLEVDGGDELAVIEGLVDGMLTGLRTYGPLDLDTDRRDWQREMDQEDRDRAVYRACKREADRRAAEAAIPDPIDDVALDETLLAAREPGA